jgi:hypothetical protein
MKMKTVKDYQTIMIASYFTQEQMDNVNHTEENNLDLITCSYTQEINYPIPRYIDIKSNTYGICRQVKKWYVNPKNKWLVIELTQGYWECWYNGYWKPKYGNTKTDTSQSCWLQQDKFEIWVTPCNYALEDEYQIDNIEHIRDVPIDQVALQTGNKGLEDEVFNPLLSYGT